MIELFPFSPPFLKINDSIEEYASDEDLVADFTDKLDEFEGSNSRFVLEDSDGNVYFVK